MRKKYPSLLIALFFTLGAFAPETLAADLGRQAQVRWVIDGDTFEVGNGEKIRLIGVDTPEYEPWKGRIDAYGRESAEFTKKLLTGRKVRLEFDAEPKDKYDRTLAYVYLESGEFVNLKLLEEGYARAMYIRPNGRHYALFKEAEKKAKNEKKGRWAARSALLN